MLRVLFVFELVFAVSQGGNNSLILSSWKGHAEIVLFLLSVGLPIDLRNNVMTSLFHYSFSLFISHTLPLLTVFFLFASICFIMFVLVNIC